MKQHSRREFVKYAVGGALIFAVPGRAGAADEVAPELRARAVALLDSTLSVDMHSHGGGIASRRDNMSNVGESMRQGRLSAMCLALVSDSPVTAYSGTKIAATREPKPGELHAHVLKRMEFADRLIEKYGMTRVFTTADLQASKKKGSAGVILAVEGSDFLDGKLDPLQVAYDRGVRHWQLVHYRAQNGLADIQTEEPIHNGSSAFGLDVVRECNRLGMVVDVAHATLAAVKQFAKVSTTPLVLSHTSFDPRPKKLSRRIAADHAKLVAETGGVIGVWANGGVFDGFAAYAEGLAKFAEAVGVDHVGVGTDLSGMPHPMFSSYVDFPDLVAHFFKHFNDEEVKKVVGGNYLRVFDKATKPRA